MVTLIEQADQNGDGKISYAEFILCMTGEADKTNLHQNAKENHRARRYSYDSNNSDGPHHPKGMLRDGTRSSSMSKLITTFQSILSVNKSAQVGPSDPAYPRFSSSSNSSSRVHQIV